MLKLPSTKESPVRILLVLILILLSGCTGAPLEMTEHLSLDNPEMLIIENTPPKNISLNWAPQPIDDFIISQNADGFTGRDDYRDFAVGRLLSTRVEEYINTVSSIISNSENRAIVTIEAVNLSYKYGWNNLAYAKLLVNAAITANGKTRSKIYYQQLIDQSKMTPSKTLESLFDAVAIELSQEILTTLTR